MEPARDSPVWVLEKARRGNEAKRLGKRAKAILSAHSCENLVHHRVDIQDLSASDDVSAPEIAGPWASGMEIDAGKFLSRTKKPGFACV